jgi:hypothetical protein
MFLAKPYQHSPQRLRSPAAEHLRDPDYRARRNTTAVHITGPMKFAHVEIIGRQSFDSQTLSLKMKVIRTPTRPKKKSSTDCSTTHDRHQAHHSATSYRASATTDDHQPDSRTGGGDQSDPDGVQPYCKEFWCFFSIIQGVSWGFCVLVLHPKLSASRASLSYCSGTTMLSWIGMV